MTFKFLASKKDRRIAAGKCSRCCKPRGASRAATLCGPCADRMREKSKERRVERILAELRSRRARRGAREAGGEGKRC